MNKTRAIICHLSFSLLCIINSWQNVVRVENMLTCRDEFEKVENSEKVQNKKSNKNFNSDIFLFFVQTFIVNYFRLYK